MPVSFNADQPLYGIRSQLNRTLTDLGTSLERLSSSKRINRAADDSAGLAIAEKLNAQNKSLGQAIQNVSNGSALLRTADGGLSQIGDLVTRGRELSVQAGNGTLSQTQRNAVDREFQSVLSEIDRISQTTEFNGRQLLSGGLDPASQNPVEVQAGTGATPEDRLSLNVVNPVSTGALGLSGLSLATPQDAAAARTALDNAAQQVVDNRSNVGALENRFQSSAENLLTAQDNIAAAENQIRGTDFARESSNLEQTRLLLQSGVQALDRALESRQSLIGGLVNTIG